MRLSNSLSAPALEDLLSMRRRPVLDVNGDRVGTLVDVYFDKATGTLEWLAVDCDLFGMRRILVPVIGARIDGTVVRVAFPKHVALDTPEVLDEELSQDLERHLYARYGLGYAYDQSPTGLATGEVAAHPVEPEFACQEWPDIPKDDPLRLEYDEVPESRRRRLRRVRFEPKDRAARRRRARELLRTYPEVPWFGAAVATLGVAVIARARRIRWAMALLQAEALALLGIAIIEKRRMEARHAAVAEARPPDEPKPSVAQRMKSKVRMR